jgi:DNA-binding LytR/AlgR family response regulator
MKVVIIEDEFFSAERLSMQLQQIDPRILVLAVLPSVVACIEWFNNNPEPDLIFSDIQLEDQESFEFFRKMNIEAPVIFTTAFDHYAIQAFKQNSIDYLLKPVDIEELGNAIKKYENLEFRLRKRAVKLQPERPKGGLKERFLVKKGSQFAIVKTSEVAYFKSDQKLTFLITHNNQKYVLDETLDQLMEQLDQRKFNRISRSRLISLDCISKIYSHFNGRLKLELVPAEEEEIFVSRERVQAFKDWLDS